MMRIALPSDRKSLIALTQTLEELIAQGTAWTGEQGFNRQLRRAQHWKLEQLLTSFNEQDREPLPAKPHAAPSFAQRNAAKSLLNAGGEQLGIIRLRCAASAKH